jgi:hypothetical protein
MLMSSTSPALRQEAVMSQFQHLPVPSETQLWVSWVLALVAVVALAVTVITGVVLLASAI